ncbi:MAG: 2-amino-4-hydroxy-6-hydroxymethyldihydropteridine diphosphokinase [Zoogloeaceae bacterium]|nr:2-amino-4-hydroxy-6-hydroxymethyldihydropteridine diphosphokinase [Zoogloeaceae bacterium]
MRAAPAPARAFIAFGANLGDPAASFEHACAALAALPATTVERRSSLYRSAPVGVEGQPDYVNGVIELRTRVAAQTLLAHLLDIEHEAGRRRDGHCAPRTLDLDLLLYDDQVIHVPGLEVPHPRMHQRAFVLLPLAEIAPDAQIPGHGPVTALLPGVADQEIARI